MTNSDKSTESSQWYTQNNMKRYSKAAASYKHFSKSDLRSHSSEECWGQCSHCGKYDHRSEKCFHKDAHKKEPAEKANKAQNNIQKKKKKKKAKKTTEQTERRETKAEESDSDIS